MGAKLSSGTSANGVMAFQDHEERSQFHYWPARADLVLGDTLPEFAVEILSIVVDEEFLSGGDFLGFDSVGELNSGDHIGQ
jgi:hypothetical protein